MTRSQWIAVATSCAVHIGLGYGLLKARKPEPLAPQAVIPVTFTIIEPAEPDPVVPPEPIPEPDFDTARATKPAVKPEPELEVSTVAPSDLPDLTAPSRDGASQPNPSIIIDPRWAAKRTDLDVIAPVVVGLTPALDCLKGFEVDCAEQRRDVFAAQQLSETDKVWMPTYANSGLSDSRFKGMSEAQIRAELSIPTAGQNGWHIPFSNIGISSAWTDSLYGVNRGCKLKFALGTDENMPVTNDCPPLEKAQKDLPLWRNGNWQPGGVEEPENAWLLRDAD